MYKHPKSFDGLGGFEPFGLNVVASARDWEIDGQSGASSLPVDVAAYREYFANLAPWQREKLGESFGSDGTRLTHRLVNASDEDLVRFLDKHVRRMIGRNENRATQAYVCDAKSTYLEMVGNAVAQERLLPDIADAAEEVREYRVVAGDVFALGMHGYGAYCDRANQTIVIGDPGDFELLIHEFNHTWGDFPLYFFDEPVNEYFVNVETDSSPGFYPENSPADKRYKYHCAAAHQTFSRGLSYTSRADIQQAYLDHDYYGVAMDGIRAQLDDAFPGFEVLSLLDDAVMTAQTSIDIEFPTAAKYARKEGAMMYAALAMRGVSQMVYGAHQDLSQWADSLVTKKAKQADWIAECRDASPEDRDWAAIQAHAALLYFENVRAGGQGS